MNATQLLTGPLAQAIGWALLHLLWQATIVAGILAAALALIPRRNASSRYAAACGALLLVFAMFVATAWSSYDPAVAAVPSAAETSSEPVKISLSEVPGVIASIAAETWRDRAIEMVARARQALPSIVAIWLAGVVFLSSRLLVSWVRARKLVTEGAQEASSEWQRVSARLSDALGLRKAVRLLESAAVEVPSVIGSLRPVILLPASTLTGLTPEQIEMVLAHELAHIRRHDFIVNLLQAVMETLMFYHPAVWWMSRRVRIERENCCDDLAVAVCGNPIQYARALTRLEELRSAPSLLVAANGGSLLDRIRRIAGGRAESTAMSARWVAAMITLVVLIIGVSVPSLPAFADRDDDQPKAAKSKVDVAVSKNADDLDIDLQVQPEAEVDVDDDVDTDVDYDVDVDVDADPDVDVDYDAPDIAFVSIAGELPSVLAATPAPAIAPTAPVVAVPTPRPAIAPRAMAIAHLADIDDVDDMDDEDTDDDEKNAKPIGSGKLSIDELISLKAVGVTPEYIDQMRSVFGDLSVRQVTSLRALGVTAEYIREMRAAGMQVDTIKAATGLRALGVTPAYLAEMRKAGVDVKTAKEAQSLKATGVTAEFVRQLAAAGYSNLSIKELTRMAAVGIDEDFIRDMAKYRDKK